MYNLDIAEGFHVSIRVACRCDLEVYLASYIDYSIAYFAWWGYIIVGTSIETHHPFYLTLSIIPFMFFTVSLFATRRRFDAVTGHRSYRKMVSTVENVLGGAAKSPPFNTSHRRA